MSAAGRGPTLAAVSRRLLILWAWFLIVIYGVGHLLVSTLPGPLDTKFPTIPELVLLVGSMVAARRIGHGSVRLVIGLALLSGAYLAYAVVARQLNIAGSELGQGGGGQWGSGFPWQPYAISAALITVTLLASKGGAITTLKRKSH